MEKLVPEPPPEPSFPSSLSPAFQDINRITNNTGATLVTVLQAMKQEQLQRSASPFRTRQYKYSYEVGGR